MYNRINLTCICLPEQLLSATTDETLHLLALLSHEQKFQHASKHAPVEAGSRWPSTSNSMPAFDKQDSGRGLRRHGLATTSGLT